MRGGHEDLETFELQLRSLIIALFEDAASAARQAPAYSIRTIGTLRDWASVELFA